MGLEADENQTARSSESTSERLQLHSRNMLEAGPHSLGERLLEEGSGKSNSEERLGEGSRNHSYTDITI